MIESFLHPSKVVAKHRIKENWLYIMVECTDVENSQFPTVWSCEDHFAVVNNKTTWWHCSLINVIEVAS